MERCAGSGLRLVCLYSCLAVMVGSSEASHKLKLQVRLKDAHI